MPKKMSIKQDNLAGSEFENVNMADTQFTNINLRGARFANINLSESRFHAINFSDVHFTGAQIGGTTFKHIGLPRGADGKQDRPRPVTFEEGMLCDSVFRKMDLTNVKIMECDVTGMMIDGIPVADLLKEWKKRNG